jgi:hypothetical protein
MPTKKSAEIESCLTSISGISRQDAAKLRICTFCKQHISGFRDTLSQREFEISGLCQDCQDDVFGREEE